LEGKASYFLEKAAKILALDHDNLGGRLAYHIAVPQNASDA
jgi:hypothetical protein